MTPTVVREILAVLSTIGRGNSEMEAKQREERAKRLYRWASRARDWADEAERHPRYKQNERLQYLAKAKRVVAAQWDDEADELLDTERGNLR